MKTLASILAATVMCGSLAAFAQGNTEAAAGMTKKQVEQSCLKEGKKRGTEAFKECVKAKGH